jgi:arylsulfatase
VIRSYYYNCISYLDSQIGRVIAYLKEKNLIENTIILFTADHGDLLGDFIKTRFLLTWEYMII